ncbi:MAG: translation initiation factor IF-2 [Bauldia sp.]|nr:translation initiation factor IF-2 [Bauldia sp.]
MTETKNTGDKTISVGQKKPTLGLKPRTEHGTVRQSFSHGRTNTVQVEIKKRRIPTPGEKPEAPPPAPAPAPAVVAAPPPVRPAAPVVATPSPAPQPVIAAAPATPARPAPAPVAAAPVTARPAPAPQGRSASQPSGRSAPQPSGRPGSGAAPQGQRPPAPSSRSQSRGGVVLKTLSEQEMDARRRALGDARIREAEERILAEENAKRRVLEEERQARERAEAERRQAEEDDRRRHEEEQRQRAEETARRKLGTETPAAEVAGARRAVEAEDDDRPGALKGRVKTTAARAPDPKPVKKAVGDDRRRGKLTLTNALDDAERERSLASMRRRREREARRGSQSGPREKVMREVIIPETITLQELANRMSERAADVIMLLMKQGQIVKSGDVIDADLAQLIVEEMGHTAKRVADADVETGLFDAADESAHLVSRPPIVTVMGHVDHGKTSLLDAIRKTNVVSGEAGGITQHIGAYQVERGGHKLTFIDTPGHAAFTAMRARGAKVTDIVILVVAADDSVMPQTVEAIQHAKAAAVPIIVAINKIDKPSADPSKVRTGLLQHEVFVESMGGDVLEVEVSATKGTNLDKLLDAVLLQSEVLDLKANPDRPAEGTVIEAKLDRGRGPVATVLVQRGTLRVGDIVVAGAEWGRVRALVSEHGETMDAAPPSTPVEVLGFQGAPDAGDRIAVVDTEARAREITDYRQRQKRNKAQARMTGARGSLEQMMNQLQTTGRKEFPLLVKADVQGSVEAIAGALEALGTNEVGARIIFSGVGGITESDVNLATASNAAVIGFNVRANKQARDIADQSGIEIRYYNIIYNLVDDVKAAMSGLLTPERRETMLGNAEILEVFNITKVGKVAGCRVTDGTVERGANVRLIRDNVVVHEGKLSTLKRFKDEVKEVPAGQECGMAFEKYEDMRVGDVIECYRVEEVKRSL